MDRIWQPLIVCDGALGTSDPCGYDDLIELANVIINNFTVIAVLGASIAFIYVGIKLLTSGGDVGAMKDAKDTGTNVLKGLFFVLAAWVIVKTITTVLLSEEFLSGSII